MGTILTRALCDHLAIDYNEIAFGVNKIDSNFLYLYDTNKGGADSRAIARITPVRLAQSA